MNCIVFLTITLCTWLRVEADISWHHGHSPLHYGRSKFSHPSYDAYRNHIKAKYYAQKAHDLAKLRSSIYGIGYGLYGYRYGSLFPKHYSSHFPLMPFIDKYPIFDLGFDGFDDNPFFFYPYHFFSDTPYYPGISGHLTGFGYPKSHHQSHSHSYEYGKGYEYKKGYEYGKGHSHGSKHSHGYHKPHVHHYPSLKYPIENHHYPHHGYVKKYYPNEGIAYESKSEPDGYEYSYVKETPDHFKGNPPHPSIYGIRYGEHGGHGYEHGKFPLRDIAYDSEIIEKARPYEEVDDIGRGFDDDKYDSKHLSNYDDKFKDDVEDLHSLSIHNDPLYDKFGSRDLIAYGSKKYEDKIKRK